MNPTDQYRAADFIFLSLCVWREARGEPTPAKVAVAYSVLNRVSRPSWWGNDILSVLFRKWQYSSLTDPHDPQLTLWPLPSDTSWTLSMAAADAAITRAVVNPAPHADSYWDSSIPRPYWANAKNIVCQIGRLTFANVDMDYEDAK